MNEGNMKRKDENRHNIRENEEDKVREVVRNFINYVVHKNNYNIILYRLYLHIK
jgi:hypothetical protein